MMKKIQDIYAFLAHLPKRDKMKFYAAGIFVLMALFDRLIIAPISSKLQSLDKQITEKEAAIKVDLRILGEKERIELESAQYRSFFTKEGSAEEEMSSLMKEVETLANKSTVYLLDMKPGTVKQSATSKEYTVTLNCEGELRRLIEFIYAIETSKKLLKTEKMQISVKSKESDTLKCSLLISKIILLKSE
ncbi:MAG: type 4a pilus biogenesis protein PilO [Candidatus Omnitrophica bacterium]|nr:type 4a pilus biogenesis protein PilO [Candidatus Omnitrophota bacterium]MDD5078756.1 type 4a pilus biogenesis protein PilO [Candidatus Omnitrophota bacterium]